MAYQPQWEQFKSRVLAIANDVKTANPDAWNALKVHGTPDRRYINLVSMACLDQDIPAGVNQKRGTQGDSIDALAFPNDSGAPDATGTFVAVEIVDIVGGAEGGPNSEPVLTWGDVTQKTIDQGEKGGWKAGSVNGQNPVPTPVTEFNYLNESTDGAAYEKRVKAAYNAVHRKFPDENDSSAFRHFLRLGFTHRHMPIKEAMDKHINELRAELGAPPE